MRRELILGAVVAALATAGCQTASHKQRKSLAAKAQKAKVKTAKVMSDEEVADDVPAPTPKKAPARAKAIASAPMAATPAASAPMAAAPVAKTPPAPVLSATELQACQGLVAKTMAYRTLYSQLAPGTYAPSGTPLDQIVQTQAADCNDTARRTAFYAAIRAQFENGRTGRIGVILPLSGQDARYATSIVNGLRVAAAESGVNFDQQIVLKDGAGTAQTTMQRLAELVFKDDVSLVVGGLDHAAGEMLAKWSADLLLPTLVLNRDRDLESSSRYAFMLYPDEKRLADTLAQAAQKRGWKRIAVLKPSSGKSNRVVDYFKKAVAANGGSVVYDLAYTSGNYDTMQGVSRQLFKADAADRADEYRRAYKKAKEEAQKAGLPFDARQVVLKPIVDFDAVFIPDDFRTVRHFAKLFKYNLVDHLPMIGNHEWRSPALIDPYDDFLDGSLFADFIGSYTKLPSAVSAPTWGGTPYFVQPQSVVNVDFQLIGYRAGKVALSGTRPLQTGARPNHRQLAEALAAVGGESAGFFTKGPAFDGDRHSNWPTYVFTVAHRSLELEPGTTVVAREP